MISKEQFEEIAQLIHSDTSPVGIDAKKTHVLILQKLLQIEADIKELKEQLKGK